MERYDLIDCYLHIARIVSLRSTCVRGTRGCVLVDDRFRVLSTGYNGGLPGELHCTEHNCPGAKEDKGSTILCEAIHAEMNAIFQCKARDQVYAAFCTDAPCFKCARAMLCALPCLGEVWYARQYADQRGIHEFAKRPVSCGRRICYGSWDLSRFERS